MVIIGKRNGSHREYESKLVSGSLTVEVLKGYDLDTVQTFQDESDLQRALTDAEKRTDCLAGAISMIGGQSGRMFEQTARRMALSLAPAISDVLQAGEYLAECDWTSYPDDGSAEIENAAAESRLVEAIAAANEAFLEMMANATQIEENFTHLLGKPEIKPLFGEELKKIAAKRGLYLIEPGRRSGTGK